MDSLITQFAALKTQMLAFEAALNNTIPPTMPDPNNIIDRMEQAKARARADIEARAAAKVAAMQQPRPYPVAYKAGYIRGQQYLDRVEREIAAAEAERAAKRRQQIADRKRAIVSSIRRQHPEMSFADVYRAARRRVPSKFEQACAEVRAVHPTLSKDEVYLRARMRLKVKENSLAALNN